MTGSSHSAVPTHRFKAERPSTLTTPVAAILAVTLVATVVIPYAIYFPYGPAKQQIAWVNFAQWCGSLLSPVFSFFSIVLLLQTLRINAQQLVVSEQEAASSADDARELVDQLTRLNIENCKHINDQRELLRIHAQTAEVLAVSALIRIAKDRLSELTGTPITAQSKSDRELIILFKDRIKKLEAQLDNVLKMTTKHHV